MSQPKQQRVSQSQPRRASTPRRVNRRRSTILLPPPPTTPLQTLFTTAEQQAKSLITTAYEQGLTLVKAALSTTEETLADTRLHPQDQTNTLVLAKEHLAAITAKLTTLSVPDMATARAAAASKRQGLTALEILHASGQVAAALLEDAIASQRGVVGEAEQTVKDLERRAVEVEELVGRRGAAEEKVHATEREVEEARGKV
ncbi:hypothetical protein CONLIGDRAFT_708033, partial [Coniochaeta ligniaria NRRL 30616]